MPQYTLKGWEGVERTPTLFTIRQLRDLIAGLPDDALECAVLVPGDLGYVCVDHAYFETDGRSVTEPSLCLDVGHFGPDIAELRDCDACENGKHCGSCQCCPTLDVRIEFPSVGATYDRPLYGVYQYSTHPETSVLAGLERRVYLDSFETLEEAKAKYPNAEVYNGPGYTPLNLGHLPDDGEG